MTKLNYGPRFSGASQSRQVSYDPALDSANWRGYRPRQRSGIGGEFDRAKQQATIKRKMYGVSLAGQSGTGWMTKADQERELYRAAETELAETLAAAYSAIHHHLTAIREIPHPKSYHSVVNVKAATDLLSTLKWKCGIATTDAIKRREGESEAA